MRKTRAFTMSGSAGLALALGACAIGPNFHKPAPPPVGAYTPQPLAAQTEAAPGPGGAVEIFAPGRAVPADWWTMFRSPPINALVARGLAASPDLAAAKAALRGANEAYLAQRAVFFPTVAVGYSLAREKANGTLATPLTDGENLFSLHTATLTVAYQPDVFGGLRRQVETAAAQAQSQKFQTEAAYLTLTTDLVVAGINQAALNEEVAAARRWVVAAEGTLEILRRQQAMGQASGVDVAVAESALAQARAVLPPLEKALGAQIDQIAELTGRYPAEVQDPSPALDDIALPADLPESLPSQLVDQRPDILAAEANLHAASAQVGVAIAARLPQFTLTGQAGGVSTVFGAVLSSSNAFYTVAGNVAQTVFDGGALLHRQKQAEAALDQAKAQYRATVLTAFENVADVLQTVGADGRAYAAAEAGEAAAKASLDLTRRQADLGQVADLAVLATEQAYEQALIARLQAQAARGMDAAALYQALGGGWRNRAKS